MDTNLTHIAAAGVVSSLVTSAAVAASVAAGAGPIVDLKGAIGTAIAIANIGVETAGSGESLAAALWESDDQITWTAVPGGAFVSSTTALELSTVRFRPGERKRYITAALTIAGTSSPSFPCGIVLLLLPGSGS